MTRDYSARGLNEGLLVLKNTILLPRLSQYQHVQPIEHVPTVATNEGNTECTQERRRNAKIP